MVNDPDFGRYLPPQPAATIATFLDSIERRNLMERERGYTMWAVDLKETATFVGQCGLYPAERTGPEIELAYHFNKVSWNMGYATEAAIAVLAHGFGPIGLDHVIAFVMQENGASRRVVEKAGMHFEGITTAYGMVGIRKYVADRDRWNALRQA